MSTFVYPAVQSGDGRVGVTHSLSRQGSDVTDHPGFCNSGWGGTEEYRSQRTYSPCVPQSPVNTVRSVCACMSSHVLLVLMSLLLLKEKKRTPAEAEQITEGVTVE